MMKITGKEGGSVKMTIDDDGRTSIHDSASGKEMSLEEYRELLRRRAEKKKLEEEAEQPEAKPDAGD